MDSFGPYFPTIQTAPLYLPSPIRPEPHGEGFSFSPKNPIFAFPKPRAERLARAEQFARRQTCVLSERQGKKPLKNSGLQKSWFNVKSPSLWLLQKTLEEPPKHVIFILATTEANKIQETILSRTEVYNFKKPTQEILKKAVMTVSEKEGFKIDKDSAELISILGDGSFRDTLGNLQKILSIKACICLKKKVKSSVRMWLPSTSASHMIRILW
jgi:hypothetical protein